MTAPVTLAQRLEHGWALIDEATDAGDHAEAQRLTDHFLNLLDQYQREQDALHWEIAAQHEWRASMRNEPFEPVSFVSGQPRASQGVLQNI